MTDLKAAILAKCELLKVEDEYLEGTEKPFQDGEIYENARLMPIIRELLDDREALVGALERSRNSLDRIQSATMSYHLDKQHLLNNLQVDALGTLVKVDAALTASEKRMRELVDGE